MVQEVYIDLYWMVNVAMDLLCLMITARLLHRTVVRWRVILGAALGGFYAVAALLGNLGGAVGVGVDLLAGFLMCTVVFAGGRMKLLGLLQVTGVNALVSVILGGMMTVLFSWLNRLELPLELLQGDSLSVWMFALLALAGGLMTAQGGKLLRRSNGTKSLLLRATIFGKTVELRAMVDSGNLLKDPLSGRAVIIVEQERLRGILPQGFFAVGQGRWIPDPETARRMRWIPTGTVTGSGMLTAFLPDALLVIDHRGSVASDYLLAPIPLQGRAQGFDALFPADT